MNGHLSNLASQPQNQSYQTTLAQVLNSFQVVVNNLRGRFKPTEIKLLEEIGAEKYFVDDISATINRWISENAVTPTVAQQKVAEFTGARQNYLDRIRQVASGLDFFGFEVDELEPGEAEIGFLLPRDIFENHLDLLIRELITINRVIRILSEAVNGTPSPIEVHQISTSDPLFFFGIDVKTVAIVGRVVTWALDTWKRVAEIRKIRSESAKTKMFTQEELEKIFDGKIKTIIESAIAEKTEELLETVPKNGGREHEQKQGIEFALDAILSRVERGMTVEVRFIPPPMKMTADGEKPPVSQEFNDLERVASQLVFPKMDGEPILTLDKPRPSNDASKNA